MAIEAVTAHSSIADTAYLTVQPTSGTEWIIHNIYLPAGSSVELYRTDGSNDIKIDSGTDSWTGCVFHVTNGIYFKVKNVSGGAIYLGYDGVISKSP